MIARGVLREWAGRQSRNGLAIGAVAMALGIATVLVRGASVDAFCWAAVQGFLVVVAAVDLRSRRIPNAIVGPVGLVVVLLRVVFARRELPSTLLAGAVIFALFLGLAIVARGGFGMGDVKLAGLLGLLLGATAVPALLIGTLAGAVASVAVLARSRSRRAAFAYGPYLCFGAVVVILALPLPRLV